MNFHNLEQTFESIKETQLRGRYITIDDLKPLLEQYSNYFTVEKKGLSVEGRDIYSVRLGNGPLKILAWSQMHGNESTTTKAVFDFLKFVIEKREEAATLLDCLSIQIIPMLNPDGAERYTRLNANNVDLNRDAQELSQPESKVLYSIYKKFKPDYCFNLHGQRTIFGVGDPAKSAVVSLLSPAQDKERSVTKSRKKGMEVIVEIKQMLDTFIPKSIGRYDDAFNINCVGDTLQHLKIPTILFEAGHYPGDYMREKNRKYIFLSLLKGLDFIAKKKENVPDIANMYFNIPENKQCFFDFILRNVCVKNQEMNDVAIQFEEKLVNNQLKFIPKVKKVGDLKDYSGHTEYDLSGKNLLQATDNQFLEGNVLNSIQIENEKTITFSIN